MYVTPHDFDLVVNGTSTATTRIGDRRKIWPVRHRLVIVDNTKNDRRLEAEIVYNELMNLRDVSRTQAGTIGGYGIKEHYDDFTSIYSGSDDSTILSLVGFRVLA
jgi:hypothetical protein